MGFFNFVISVRFNLLKVLSVALLIFVLGCEQKASSPTFSAQPTDTSSASTDTPFCVSGEAPSDPLRTVVVPDGKCKPLCNSQGTAYVCTSQAMIVCNPGYKLAENNKLECVKNTVVVPTCTTTQHLENNICVNNTRTCTIANAVAREVWSGTAWGACTVVNCKAGFTKQGNTCVTIPTCTTTQHLENNVCVNNTRTCTILNSVAQEVWSGTAWGACTVVSCDTGFIKQGNTCVAIPTCTATQHLENNVCVNNTRTCTISNAVAREVWNGAAWGACTVVSCKAGFIKQGNTCVAIPTCTTTQHLENNVCVNNTRTCTILNAVAQEVWSGTAWGACTVMSCDTGFTKQGNTCVASAPTCTTTQHLENNVCVNNTRTCTILNAVAQEVWSGTAWGACTVVSCNTGFIKQGNTCVLASASTVKMYVDSKAFNPEAENPWTEINVGATKPTLFLGKVKSNETKPPIVKMRIVSSSGALTHCSTPSVTGVEISSVSVISAQEIQYTLKLNVSTARIINTDYTICGSVNGTSTNQVIKLSGEVQ